MGIDILSKFIKEYSRAVEQGTAAIFAGAGMSRESGYVNWKNLLRDFANDIRLDVDKESDLISIAQFYKNEMGNRSTLNQEIIDKFTLATKPNSYMNALSVLPIKTYWTTNYDHIIEDTLKAKGHCVDVKISSDNLATNKEGLDTIVYKFHGDVSFPEKAVLTKEDYELFESTHKLFITALQGDLISKTFLYVGYSFNDPNLDLILSRIRILMGENKRDHYCIMRCEKESDYTSNEDYIYAKTKQELKSKDLRRYGIHTIFIDEYSEISEILHKVFVSYISKRIFIAGSCRNYAPWDTKDAYNFLYNLGYELINNGYQVSSGFSEGVGPQIVNGALTAISSTNRNLERYLQIKPLPLINGKDDKIRPEAKKLFQNDMMSQAGIVIILFGNQYYDGKLSNSKGVFHDYQRALEHKRFIIPVGVTGYSALEIQKDMEIHKDEYPYLQNYWEDLRNEKDINALVQLILTIIKKINTQT